jgi:hypothetical protein
MSVIRWSPRIRPAVRYSIAAVMAFGLVQLSACHEPVNTSVAARAAQEEAPDPGPSFPTSVSGLNYTTAYIARFRIIDANGNAGGGPNIAPADGSGKPAGGGAESCCVIVPEKWQKGMEVTVSWRRDTHPYDHENRTGDQWLKALAKVPPYSISHYNFWVQFLDGDRIRVRVADDSSMNKPNADGAYIAQGVLDEEANKEMHL